MKADRIVVVSALGLICLLASVHAAQDVQGLAPPALPKGAARRNFVPPLPDESNLRYRGTTVRHAAGAVGDELAVQKLVAAKLSRLDFVPAPRAEHFRWMTNYPVKLIRWNGLIKGAVLTPNGVTVRVRVWPDVVPTRGKPSGHSDYFLEDYLLSDDGSLEFVGFQDPGPREGFTGPML